MEGDIAKSKDEILPIYVRKIQAVTVSSSNHDLVYIFGIYN